MAFTLGQELKITSVYFVDDKEPFVGVVANIAQKEGLSLEQFRAVVKAWVEGQSARYNATGRFLAPTDFGDAGRDLVRHAEALGVPSPTAERFAAETIAAFGAKFSA